MGSILIVDDEELLRILLTDMVEEAGHRAVSAATLFEGLQLARHHPFDLVFLDVRLPDGNGLDALPGFRSAPSQPEVFIITGVKDSNGAELAIQSGAWNYIQKPFTKNDILLQIKRALDYHQKKTTTSSHRNLDRGRIIGQSAELNRCLDQVAQCAGTDANVLITGETGTGKELLAQAIHRNSPRADKHFIIVDCAALPEHLIESILFGHVKGAFTGADQEKKGLIAQADEGTLFLDEVGELPPVAQKSFLRVLQERRFRPVGSDRERASNFRLVAATHRDLDLMVAESQFRSDLLYRLRTFAIHIPPLRARNNDIESMAVHFVFTLCNRHRMPIKGMLPEFLEMLSCHDWPGNVRELLNSIEKAVLADPANPTLFPQHLDSEIRLKFIQAAAAKKDDSHRSEIQSEFPVPELRPPPVTPFPLTDGLPTLKNFRRSAYDQIEKQYLFRLMAETSEDIEKACKISGLGRSRLYSLLKHHSLTLPADKP
ncbi:MAG: sigma-54 dependent transcriptional regulator [Pseudomonadota bacterium]